MELLASGSRLLVILDTADKVAMCWWCAGGAVSVWWTALHATRTRSYWHIVAARSGTREKGLRISRVVDD